MAVGPSQEGPQRTHPGCRHLDSQLRVHIGECRPLAAFGGNRLSIWPSHPLVRCKVGLGKQPAEYLGVTLISPPSSSSPSLLLCPPPLLHHSPFRQRDHQNKQPLWKPTGSRLCQWAQATTRSWELQRLSSLIPFLLTRQPQPPLLLQNQNQVSGEPVITVLCYARARREWAGLFGVVLSPVLNRLGNWLKQACRPEKHKSRLPKPPELTLSRHHRLQTELKFQKRDLEKDRSEGSGKAPPVYSCSQEWRTVWMNHPGLSTLLSDTCGRINTYWRRAKM